MAAMNDDLAGVDFASRWSIAHGLRFTLAMIADDQDAVDAIEAELGDCPDCLRGLGRHLAGVLSGVMILRFGREGAAKVAQGQLDELVNAPWLFGSGSAP
jgi:hypothetical protein